MFAKEWIIMKGGVMQHRTMLWPNAPIQAEGSETSDPIKTGYGSQVPSQPKPEPEPKKEKGG
jgi:hypothetical protein